MTVRSWFSLAAARVRVQSEARGDRHAANLPSGTATLLEETGASAFVSQAMTGVPSSGALFDKPLSAIVTFSAIVPAEIAGTLAPGRAGVGHRH